MNIYDIWYENMELFFVINESAISTPNNVIFKFD